ncbi:flagellar biosynthesis protein FliW [bacterium]|nr:MAG: flagellar biosynthesis protein FliW [bacterium]
MKINTIQFGEVEFSPENTISFSSGIIGFENLKSFLLIKTEDDLFYWLNSIERPDIAFPMVGTRVIDENYPEEGEHEGFAIVTLNKDPLKITANLKAPVYVNQEMKSGFQRVIDSDKYPVNFNLFIE